MRERETEREKDKEREEREGNNNNSNKKRINKRTTEYIKWNDNKTKNKHPVVNADSMRLNFIRRLKELSFLFPFRLSSGFKGFVSFFAFITTQFFHLCPFFSKLSFVIDGFSSFSKTIIFHARVYSYVWILRYILTCRHHSRI